MSANPPGSAPQECVRCHRVAPLQIWVGEGGIMGYVHGAYQMWCERCIVEAQLEHALRADEGIPTLKARLKELANGD